MCTRDERVWELLRKKHIYRDISGSKRKSKTKLAWMDNTNSWTGLGLADVSRMLEDRVQRHKVVYSVAYPCIKEGWRREQTRHVCVHKEINKLSTVHIVLYVYILLTLPSKKSALQNYGEYAEVQKQPWAARICRIFSTSRSQASRLSLAMSRSILSQQFNGSVHRFICSKMLCAQLVSVYFNSETSRC